MGEIATTKPSPFELLLDSPEVRKRFRDPLGDEAPEFMSTILTVYQGSFELRSCDPASIIYAAAESAGMRLSISPSKGHACIIPYGRKAQFQIMARGWIQLALDTGKYETINDSPVYEGELISHDHITGDVVFDTTKKKSDKLIGWVCYFKLLAGYRKYVYMTVEELNAHGKRWSKSYHKASGLWKKNPPFMYAKTVVKQAITKYGPTSPSISRAQKVDQAAIDEKGRPSYIDTFASGTDEKGQRIYEMPTGKDKKGKKKKAAKVDEDGFEEFYPKGSGVMNVDNKEVFVIKDAQKRALITDSTGVRDLAKKAHSEKKPLKVRTEERPTGQEGKAEEWILEARLG